MCCRVARSSRRRNRPQPCPVRHCPKCQGAAAREWLAEREAELLPVPYFHVVFSLPAKIARTRPRSTTSCSRPRPRSRSTTACPYDRSGRRHLARWCALGRLPTRLSQSAALGARGDFAASSQQAAIKLQVQFEDAAGNRAGVLIAGNAAILPSPPRDGSKPRPSFTTIRTLRRSSGMSSGRTLSRQIAG